MSQPTYTPYQTPTSQPSASPYAATPVVYGGSPYMALGPVDHPQAQMVMIMGILGLVVAQVCAPIAWYMGAKAKKEIAANPGMYRDGGSLQAGYIMGIIGTVLLGIFVVIMILYFLLFAGLGLFALSAS